MSDFQQTIESAEAVFAILETFRKNRTPMSVTEPQSEDIFNTYLLKAEKHQLCIDQLVPNSGNLLLHPGQAIEFRIRYQGTTYFFRAIHLARSWDKAGHEYHQMATPGQIHYLDNRVNYRIQIKLAQNPAAQISVANEKPAQVRCENISKTGACLRLQGDHFPIETNQIINCIIQLDGFEHLTCQGIVRYQQHLAASRKGKRGKVGIEFIQLPPADKKKLHTVLMKMQRLNLRTNMTL